MDLNCNNMIRGSYAVGQKQNFDLVFKESASFYSVVFFGYSVANSDISLLRRIVTEYYLTRVYKEYVQLF